MRGDVHDPEATKHCGEAVGFIVTTQINYTNRFAKKFGTNVLEYTLDGLRMERGGSVGPSSSLKSLSSSTRRVRQYSSSLESASGATLAIDTAPLAGAIPHEP
jgi:hypothetical protein